MMGMGMGYVDSTGKMHFQSVNFSDGEWFGEREPIFKLKDELVDIEKLRKVINRIIAKPVQKRQIAESDPVHFVYFWADENNAELLRPYGNLLKMSGNQWELLVDNRYDTADIQAYITALA
jgi:hypothetical protein